MENSQDPIVQLLLNGPAMIPPLGVIPNLDSPPNHQSASLAVAIICVIVPTVLTLLHAYIKMRLMKSCYVEDYLLFLSWATYISYMGVTMMLVDSAPVVHQWDLRLRDIPNILYVSYVGSILNGAMSALIKISILLQIIRIFVPRGTRNIIYWVGHVSIVLIAVQYFIGCFVIIFACIPRKKFWYPLMPGGKCLEIKAMYTSGAVTNIVSDIMILVLPQVVIWGLQINKRKKRKLIGAFLVGIFATGFAAARLYLSIQLARSQDFSFYIACIGLVTYPEMTIGFLIMTVPVLPRLFQHIDECRHGTHSTQSRPVTQRSIPTYTLGASRRQSGATSMSLRPTTTNSSKGGHNIEGGSANARSTERVGEEMDVFSVNPTKETSAV